MKFKDILNEEIVVFLEKGSDVAVYKNPTTKELREISNNLTTNIRFFIINDKKEIVVANARRMTHPKMSSVYDREEGDKLFLLERDGRGFSGQAKYKNGEWAITKTDTLDTLMGQALDKKDVRENLKKIFNADYSWVKIMNAKPVLDKKKKMLNNDLKLSGLKKEMLECT
jgi:hypothetical protein